MPIKKHPFNNLETFNNCLCRELTLWGHLRFDGTLFAAAIQFLYSLKVGKLGPAPATIWFRHQAQMRAIHTTIWVPLSAQINYIIYIMQRGAWMLRGFKGGTCKPPIWNRPVHIDTQLVRACWSQNRVQYLESVRRNLSSCFSLCLASHAQQLIRRPSWFWKKQRRARCPLPSLQLSTCFLLSTGYAEVSSSTWWFVHCPPIQIAWNGTLYIPSSCVGGRTQGDHLWLPLVQPQPCQDAVLDTEVGDILDFAGCLWISWSWDILGHGSTVVCVHGNRSEQARGSLPRHHGCHSGLAAWSDDRSISLRLTASALNILVYLGMPSFLVHIAEINCLSRIWWPAGTQTGIHRWDSCTKSK